MTRKAIQEGLASKMSKENIDLLYKVGALEVEDIQQSGLLFKKEDLEGQWHICFGHECDVHVGKNIFLCSDHMNKIPAAERGCIFSAWNEFIDNHSFTHSMSDCLRNAVSFLCGVTKYEDVINEKDFMLLIKENFSKSKTFKSANTVPVKTVATTPYIPPIKVPEITREYEAFERSRDLVRSAISASAMARTDYAARQNDIPLVQKGENWVKEDPSEELKKLISESTEKRDSAAKLLRRSIDNFAETTLAYHLHTVSIIHLLQEAAPNEQVLLMNHLSDYLLGETDAK